MKFITLTGKTLLKVIADDEITPEQLRASGIHDESVVRVNQQGDVEVRREENWDVIGGLLGDYEHRLKRVTHQDWADP